MWQFFFYYILYYIESIDKSIYPLKNQRGRQSQARSVYAGGITVYFE